MWCQSFASRSRTAPSHKATDTLYEDAMIAATAAVRQLTVVTRNVAGFKGLGVSVLNPFAPARR
jgi:toxin FitB